MCGIGGFSGSFDSELLDKMSLAMAHRGPDDNGVIYLENHRTGLCHRRLSIIDLSPLGHQPMADTSENVVIVFNGEIYNFRELRTQLLAEGHQFRSHSDTEVLLNLYLARGKDMLSVLNGIFAFAIFDLRNHELLIARDHLGVKPFYYSECEKGFIFASELKALLKETSISSELDLAAVSDYLTYLWSPSPRTILKKVKKLEPGHAVVVKHGKIKKKWSFYDLPYGSTNDDITVDEAISETRRLLAQAVKSQMVSDVPVGAFLSGGLDSSAVVAFAKKAQPESRIQCFTIAYRDGEQPEMGMAPDLPFAKRVAEHLDVDLHVIEVGSEMIMDIEKMVYFLDEPQADPAPLNVLYISKLAKRNGMKVLLSGAGGDDIFTGYRRHFALMQERYWSRFPRFARLGMKRISGSFPHNVPAFRRLAKAFSYADLEGDKRLVSYFNWISPSKVTALFSDEALHQYRSEMRNNLLLSSLERLPAEVPPLNRMLYLEAKHFLADHNLNYTDKMGMAESVEIRVPLLDTRLVDFATRLPIEFKQKGSIGKWIFKKAMEPYLPSEVIYRPKTGFGAPMRYWLRNDLNEVVSDVLSRRSLVNRGIFDDRQVGQLIEQDKAGRIDAAYTIFGLMCIELWCRVFLDRRMD